jgi:hypothetical protein
MSTILTWTTTEHVSAAYSRRHGRDPKTLNSVALLQVPKNETRDDVAVPERYVFSVTQPALSDNGARSHRSDLRRSHPQIAVPRAMCLYCAYAASWGPPFDDFNPREIGRDAGIRTRDPLTPSQVRYQAALHPVN